MLKILKKRYIRKSASKNLTNINCFKYFSLLILFELLVRRYKTYSSFDFNFYLHYFSFILFYSYFSWNFILQIYQSSWKSEKDIFVVNNCVKDYSSLLNYSFWDQSEAIFESIDPLNLNYLTIQVIPKGYVCSITV